MSSNRLMWRTPEQCHDITFAPPCEASCVSEMIVSMSLVNQILVLPKYDRYDYNKFMYLKYWIVLLSTLLDYSYKSNDAHNNIFWSQTLPPSPQFLHRFHLNPTPLPTPSPDMSWCKQTGSMTDSILSEDFFIIYKDFNVLLYLYLSWLINKMT